MGNIIKKLNNVLERDLEVVTKESQSLYGHNKYFKYMEQLYRSQAALR